MSIEKIKLQFTSGNCIPVERSVVMRKDWLLVEEKIDQQAARIDILEQALKESQDWNWISAQDAAMEKGQDFYEIQDMQDLHDIAFNTTLPTKGDES